MRSDFTLFERLTRIASSLTYAEEAPVLPQHPFDVRNINSALPTDVRKLFDNGHYAQATFEAYKFLDKEIARLAGSGESGVKLMMSVLSEANPVVKLTKCSNTSEKDEQKGYQFLFAGSTMAIRNPRGHEYAVHDSPDDCLDHLSLASMLLWKLEVVG